MIFKLHLTTCKKLAIASILSRFILFLRGLAGKLPSGVFHRDGFAWELDLREGIDFSIYLLGGFEVSTKRAYARFLKPKWIVFDVGANIGAHTLPMARSVSPGGKVYAFEATEFAISKLRKNLSLNPDVQALVSVHHCLLTDGCSVTGNKEVYSSWPLNGNPENCHPHHGGRLHETGTDQQYSLDQFVEEQEITRVGFIKLDVDGQEWNVLQGAKRILDQFHPAILIELAPDYAGVNIKEILEFFWNRQYVMYMLPGDQALPRDCMSIIKKIPNSGSINVLARWEP